MSSNSTAEIDSFRWPAGDVSFLRHYKAFRLQVGHITQLSLGVLAGQAENAHSENARGSKIRPWRRLWLRLFPFSFIPIIQSEQVCSGRAKELEGGQLILINYFTMSQNVSQLVLLQWLMQALVPF